MPDNSARKVTWAPHDAILGYFHELTESPAQEDELYVLALLMIRRRIVRLEETERDDDGREIMHLYCPSEESEFQVPVVEPTPQRIEEIQAELASLLFSAVK
jgi:hypothetical protein